MNVLLINDDGHHSTGSAILANALRNHGHVVYSFLPYMNHSACSAFLRLGQHVKIQQENTYKYIIHGTPVECVHIGLAYLKMIGLESILVISGINCGLNYGTTTVYSGTVAAASEAILYDLQGIAISAHNSIFDCLENLTKLANWIEQIAIYVQNHPLRDKILNVNIFDYDGQTWNPDVMIENTEINRKYILPRIEMQSLEENNLLARIQCNDEKSNEFKGKCMIGILSRGLMPAIDPKQDVWIKEMWKSLNLE